MLRTSTKISKSIKILFHKYWDYTGFIINSILFYFLGLPFFHLLLQSDIPILLLIIIAPFIVIIISRAIVIYGGCNFLRIFRINIPFSWQNILTLGGIRGGIAVALVLSLPAGYEFRDLFITLIISLIAIKLTVNPILLNQYLKNRNIK